MAQHRIERDGLGPPTPAASCAYGIHTTRARGNFRLRSAPLGAQSGRLTRDEVDELTRRAGYGPATLPPPPESFPTTREPS